MLRTDAMVPLDARARDALKQYAWELEKWIELFVEARRRISELGGEIYLYDRDAADRLASATVRLEEALDNLRMALNELRIDLMIVRVN